MNLKLIFSLLFFEHRYLTYLCYIDLRFSVSGPEVLPEGNVSQIFVLGLSFDFM